MQQAQGIVGENAEFAPHFLYESFLLTCLHTLVTTVTKYHVCVYVHEDSYPL